MGFLEIKETGSLKPCHLISSHVGNASQTLTERSSGQVLGSPDSYALPEPPEVWFSLRICHYGGLYNTEMSKCVGLNLPRTCSNLTQSLLFPKADLCTGG